MTGETTDGLHPSSGRDDELEQVLAEYLRSIEAGKAPSRDDLLARHPRLAAELRDFLDNRERLEDLARPLRSIRSTPPPLETIRYFGDYELLEEIARGGMGVVYRALQRSLNRRVAVKMILAGELASSQDVERFRIEAEAAAGLDHPNIVPIYEIGEHEGRRYFSMKLVAGENLSTRIESGPLPPREAAETLSRIAGAVHYAHQRGILHRDLKPANILLDEKGEPQITDFGLAKRVEDDSDLTRSGVVLGTPTYMAPEQASGEKRSVTTASDVYSLGAILYTMLTGRPPFQEATPIDTLRKLRDEEPEHPSRIVPGLDRDLETICLKCLSREPERRYSSARELAEDLERHLAGEPILARRPGTWERLAMWARRKPAIAGLSAALLAVFLGGFVGVTLLWFRAEGEWDRAEKRESEAREAKGTAERLLSDLERANGRLGEVRAAIVRRQQGLYRSLLREAQAAVNQRRFDLANERLDECPLELRDWGWRYLKRIANPGDYTLEGRDCIAFHPDGKRLATGAAGNTIRIWDLDASKIVRTFRDDKRPRSLAFSPDGTVLASVGDGQLKLWNPETGEARDLEGATVAAVFRLDGALAQVGSKRTLLRDKTSLEVIRELPIGHPVAFGPYGRSVIGKGGDGRAVLWGLGSTAGESRILGDWKGPSSLAYDPLHEQLAIHHGDIALLELTGGSVRTLPQVSSSFSFLPSEFFTESPSLCFSPDGGRLASWRAYAADPEELRIVHDVVVWDLSSDAEEQIRRVHSIEKLSAESWSPPTRHITDLQFSPDGDWLASADSEAVRLWKVSGEHASARPFGPPRDRASALAFSPDGTRLAAAGRTVRVFDVNSELEVLQASTDSKHCVAFSPDGTLLAAGGRTLDVWKVGGGLIVVQVPQPSHGVAFSPDGRFLVACGFGFLVAWDTNDLSETGTRDLTPSRGGRQELHTLAFNARGDRLAAGGDELVQIWRVEREQPGRFGLSEVHRLRSGFPAARLCFNPGGTRLVVVARTSMGIGAENVVVYDVETGDRLRGWVSPGRDTVFDVDFSPDGRLMATADWSAGSFDSILLWDALSGERLPCTPRSSSGKPLVAWSVAFSPDGLRLVAGVNSVKDHPGSILVWDTAMVQEPPRDRNYAAIDRVIDTPTTPIPKGTEWRFFRGRKEPSPIRLAWTRPSFDDSDWETGATGIGYGDGDDETILDDMKGQYATLFLRRSFVVPDPTRVESPRLDVEVDDGFVAYLNGEEIGRLNAGVAGEVLPVGTLADRRLEASSQASLSVEPRLLVPGRNLLAIQVLNGSLDSSDLSISPVLTMRSRPGLEQDRERTARLREDLEFEEAAARLDYLQGRILERAGFPDRALAHFRRVVEKDKSHVEPAFHLARCLRQTGKPEQALPILERILRAALEASSEVWELWFQVALVDLERPGKEALRFLAGLERSRISPVARELRWALDRLETHGAIRINCGGLACEDVDGTPWAGDRYFRGGITSPSAETTQERDCRFESARAFQPTDPPGSGYRIPLPPGRYRVSLDFGTLDLSPGRAHGPLVEIEGKRSESRAKTVEIESDINDGFLDLRFPDLTWAVELLGLKVASAR